MRLGHVPDERRAVRLPSFTALPGADMQDHHTAGIIIAPSIGYMDRAYRDARTLGWSREPIIEMLIPSTLDDSLAPEGAHVASLFCQHVAPELPDQASWEDCRDRVADLMIATVDRYAPGFAGSVVARQALGPPDLERDVRPDRRRHLPRCAHPRSDLCRAANAGLRGLPRSCPGSLPLRRGRPPGRRGHRRTGAQCRTRDRGRLQASRFSQAPSGKALKAPAPGCGIASPPPRPQCSARSGTARPGRAPCRRRTPPGRGCAPD